MTTGESGIEKRAAPRHRVLKHGTLAFGSGGSVDCMVRNLSANGARLDIANPVGLPDSFTLVIEADRFRRHCHAVWSSDKRIGVAFD
jgi:PilZ domain